MPQLQTFPHHRNAVGVVQTLSAEDGGRVKLTAAQLRALRILRLHAPLTPREFAEKMWPHSDAWQHSVKCGPSGSHRGGGMYLAGGGYLGKLARRGLAKRIYRTRFGRFECVGYGLDTRGVQALRESTGVRS